jgi:hypothetical protein
MPFSKAVMQGLSLFIDAAKPRKRQTTIACFMANKILFGSEQRKYFEFCHNF